MELTIRPAQVDDAQPLLLLMAQLTQESTTIELREDVSRLSQQQQKEALAWLETSQNQLVLVVADEADQLYGIATVSPVVGQPASGELGLGVLALVQGQGLGQALMEEVLAWFNDYSHLRRLQLTVQSQNTVARHIYRKYGFDEVADSRRAGFDLIGQPVETVEMVMERDCLA